MGPVARAWCKAQDPALIRAIRHAFCHHHEMGIKGRRGAFRTCRCLTPEDERVLAEWVERTVMRGRASVLRSTENVVGIVSPRGLGAGTVKVELMGADGHYHEVTDGTRCWFPTCDREHEHRGQHSGIREAGSRLVELGKVAREIANLPDSDLGRRAELVALLVRLAAA